MLVLMLTHAQAQSLFLSSWTRPSQNAGRGANREQPSGHQKGVHARAACINSAGSSSILAGVALMSGNVLDGKGRFNLVRRRKPAATQSAPYIPRRKSTPA